jgi:hypothetical protein
MAYSERYQEGTDLTKFERIEKASSYNHNYYFGYDGDILYALSDDDNTTEWYLIQGERQPIYLGVSHVSQDDKYLHQVGNI